MASRESRTRGGAFVTWEDYLIAIVCFIAVIGLAVALALTGNA